ncbi:AzlD family protein [Saccharospirillum alexandrii]|uniref:AzlD family protein n=1 Tax=Saccharospirillum alexandrii TaxID=2448477 RepID=UPI0037352317
MMATDGINGLIVIALMAAVSLLARFGGVLVMAVVPINHRVESFINAMSASVLVAVLVPVAVEGDLAARMALLATAMVMLVMRRPMPAIAAGISVAAGWRYLM